MTRTRQLVRRLRIELTARERNVSLTTLLLGLMLIGGVLLRIQGLGSPRTFTFDEELFVKNAHAYLVGTPDQNDHPPLGKLLMVPGLLAFGYNSLGWRFAALCFGLHTLCIAYLLGQALFDDRRAGYFAAAFVGADGFFIAYSRAGLLDGILACVVLWSLLAAVTARSSAGVFAAAAFVGLAASIKWSGTFAVFPALAAVLVFGQAPRWAVLYFAVVPLLHVAIWLLGLRLTAQASDLASLGKLMLGLFRHHLERGHEIHALASPWYSWPISYHPIVVKLSSHGQHSFYASSLGNPALWLAASAALGALLLAVTGAAVRARGRRCLGRIWQARSARAVLVLAVGWLALIFPWTIARGKFTFMYHYLPSYGFALVLLGGSAAWLERRRPSLVSAFVTLVLALGIYFVPVWAELSISEAAANRRLVFTTWRP